MTVEIIAYEIREGDVTLRCIDCSEEHLQWLERTRDDQESELEFLFSGKGLKYLYHWLKRQKAVQGSKTWGEALASVVGTVTTINAKYRVWDY